jgi:arsenite methyltransferase
VSVTDAQEVKACCARLYGSDAVRWVLGDELHPGGADLTSRLISALAPQPASLVVDVACGPGTSSLQAAGDTGCEVVGIDLSTASLERARKAAREAGLERRCSFVEADAERLPLVDASADGVLCECALCTFPDKPAALGEMFRVLRPGARLALSDVTARPGALSERLLGLSACAACVGDARPLDEQVAMIKSAGFRVDWVEVRDEALAELAERARARLRLARALKAAAPPELAGAVDEALAMADEVRSAIGAGDLGYAAIVARRP